jgi:hypothetical protein
MVLKLGERGFKFVFNLIVGTFSHDIIPPERLRKFCAIGQAYYRPRLILGAGQVAVSQTRWPKPNTDTAGEVIFAGVAMWINQLFKGLPNMHYAYFRLRQQYPRGYCWRTYFTAIKPKFPPGLFQASAPSKK